MKIKSWHILLIFSVISLVALMVYIYSGLSGNVVKDTLYRKNVDGRLIKVSNYINDYIDSYGKTPSEGDIKKKFKEKDLFKCLLTNEPLIFIPDMEKQYSGGKKLLIFNPKSYFSKKQEYGSFGDGREVRNNHSFHISLVLENGSVYWKSLSSSEFFDTLLPQLENDTTSNDEDNKEVIIKVIEHYLEYSKNP